MNSDAEPGASFACTEPPDICFWRCVGRVSANDFREMFAVQKRFAEGKRYILVLVDLSQLDSVSAEGRKAAALEGKHEMPIRGMAVFGASFHFRVLAQAVSTAGRLLHRDVDNPAYFCRTEAQARTWLAQRRAILLKEFPEPIPT
jgi:hypothetical protein